MKITQRKTNMIKTRRNGGFTIIETLVAITILMIAIAGPLVAANRGLTAAVYSKDQLIATYLAQDTMEFIKYTKNNNLFLDKSDWIDGFDNCIKPKHCDVGSADANIMENITNPMPLNLDSSGFYTHDPASIGSIFSRQFTLTQISDNEYRAEVNVFWNEGNISNEVDLSSIITSITRQL